MLLNDTATQPLLNNEGENENENEHAEANYSKCYEYSAKAAIGLSVAAVIGITLAVDMLEQEHGNGVLLLGMITIFLGCSAAGGVGMCCHGFFFPKNAPAENHVPVAQNAV